MRRRGDRGRRARQPERGRQGERRGRADATTDRSSRTTCPGYDGESAGAHPAAVDAEQHLVPQRRRRRRPARDRDAPHGSTTTAADRTASGSARALGEPAATQFLTLTFAQPSSAVERRIRSSPSRASTKPSCPWWCHDVVEAGGPSCTRRQRRRAQPDPQPQPPRRRAGVAVRHRCCSPRVPRTRRRTRGSRPARTPRRSRTCSGRCSSSPASSACSSSRPDLRRHPLQGPRPADPRADPRQARARVHVHRHPGRDLAVIGGFTVSTVFALNNTDDTECVDQRHRPAVVVGVRLPGRRRRLDLRLHADTAAASPIVTSGQMVIPTEHQGARSAARAAT